MQSCDVCGFSYNNGKDLYYTSICIPANVSHFKVNKLFAI